MFSRWTVSGKISGLVAIGLPLLIFVAVSTYNTANKMMVNAGWVSHTHEVLQTKEEITSLLKDAETGQRGYLITGDPHYLEPYSNAIIKIPDALRRIRQLTADNAAQQSRLGEMDTLIAGKLQELKETIDLRTAQGFEAARSVVITDRGKQVMDRLRGKLDEFEAAERTLLKIRNAETEASAGAVKSTIIFGNLGYLAVVITLAFIVIRGLNATLHQSVRALSEGAEQLSSAANQVSASSQSLAQGSSEQAASLQEISASSGQINSMARKNTADTRSAADLMTQSQQKFFQTNLSLEQMVVSMGEINSQSAKISNIIKTIDEIAFQTNILALNAAVEAARAGEAGMGFAVVADEVRNLAQRCAQAAKDTAALIEESIAKSNDGKAKVDQVVSGIRAITDETNLVKKLVDEVNFGSQEQARGIEQIATTIETAGQVTQRNAATAEESASASEELAAQSEGLKAIVDQLMAMVGGDQRRGLVRSSHRSGVATSDNAQQWRTGSSERHTTLQR